MALKLSDFVNNYTERLISKYGKNRFSRDGAGAV